MAGVEGLEPSQAVLETDVLPLTLYPYETFSILAYKIKKINTKNKKSTSLVDKTRNYSIILVCCV